MRTSAVPPAPPAPPVPPVAPGRGRAARDRAAVQCSQCGWRAARWQGRCGECQAWGSLEEVGATPAARTVAGLVSAAARPIAEIDVEAARARPTGVPELDRVLGGGLVPGAVVLLAGEPGVGKSTLLLDVAARVAETGGPVLYLTGEESAPQVRLRAERIGALSAGLYLAAETDLAAALGQVEAVRPELLVLDSVQTFGSAAVDGSPGGVAQVREVAAAMVRVARDRAMSVVLVGHVTKDGSVAGPRLLEHVVDVVLSFEGDRHSRLRLVRGVKNRFGAADEVGCFDLRDDGITGLADPSGLFVSRHERPVPGTCVTVTLEGKRALLAEVQALIGAPAPGSARRSTSGLDPARVAMLLAVLESRGRLKVADREVYTATVGGVRVSEPAADLALALALSSAQSGTAVPAGLVAFGEVGLAGELRPVTGVGRRLAEAARLGFTHALVPPDPGRVPAGIRVLEVADIGSALAAALTSTRGAAGGTAG